MKHLKENLANSLKYELTKISNIDPDSIYYEATFEDGDKLEVKFMALDCEPFENGSYDCTMYVNGSPYSNTNKHQPFLTMRTVINIVNDFIGKVQPQKITYDSVSNSDDVKFKPDQRDLLYSRYFTQHLDSDYKYVPSIYGGGELVRKIEDTERKRWVDADKYLSRGSFFPKFAHLKDINNFD